VQQVKSSEKAAYSGKGWLEQLMGLMGVVQLQVEVVCLELLVHLAAESGLSWSASERLVSGSKLALLLMVKSLVQSTRGNGLQVE
jgi:hypothetical protein